MGISLNFAPLVVATLAKCGQCERLITLGRQSLDFTAAEARKIADACGVRWLEQRASAMPFTQEEFFTALGFGTVHSVDFNDSEGPTHIFDLNSPLDRLAPTLRNSYDVVLNGGTLEHIFDVRNGLINALAMVRIGGSFIHIGPLHNYVDHGFYQFSPTFFFDFAASNEWLVVESAAIRISVVGKRIGACDISPLPPARFGTVGELDDHPYLHYLVMRRRPASSLDRVPMQRIYATKDTDRLVAVTEQLTSFAPYRVEGGRQLRAGDVDYHEPSL